MHDLRVSLVEGSTAPEGALRAALARSGASRDVAAAAERLVAPDPGRRLHGRAARSSSPAASSARRRGAAVDTLELRAGGCRPRSAAQPSRARAQLRAPSTTCRPRAQLTLAGGRRVRYAGQVLAPEYFIVTAPGADFGAESAFAVVFAPLAHRAGARPGSPGRVNQLVLRLRPDADAGAVQARLTACAARRRCPNTGFTFTARDQEPAHRLIYKDAEGDQQMLDIFALLLLGAATFAAFNLISRTVEAQRREIGIGMALGVEPRALARRPFLLGAQIALARRRARRSPSASPPTRGWPGS